MGQIDPVEAGIIQPDLFGEHGPVIPEGQIVPKAIGARILGSLAEQLDEKKRRPRPFDTAENDARSMLLLVDGRAVLDACYYATIDGDSRAPNGVPNGGVSGFSNLLLQAIRRVGPSHILVTFDHPEGADARKKLLPSYKGNRAEKPLEHLVQIDQAMRICRALGLRVASPPGGEADDAIASVVNRCSKEMPITILSQDKDLLQLLARPHTKILWKRRGEWIGAEGDPAAFARLGVRCNQVGDFLALVGDSSDCIPGCPGIGEKTARELLAAHVCLTGIYAALGRLRVARPTHVENLLRAGRAAVHLARAIVTLRTDLESIELPRDAFDVRRELGWDLRHAKPGTLDLLAKETGLLWLVREAQALTQPE